MSAKSKLYPVLIIHLIMALPIWCIAQFPYNESFRNTTAPGVILGGSAKLTAATGIDAAGSGYLRLNENVNNSVGYAYGQDAFASNYGLTVSFEFFSWKSGATLTNQADGMTFFLFDASVNAFRPGGSGGSLGYAQYYNTPGMAKGYIGIALDDFGNYSSATDGNKNGGPGQQRGSVAIRGPGNGRTTTDYVYQTGVIASDPAYNAGFAGFTQRYPDATDSRYRKIKITLTPGSSLGSNAGYTVSIIIYKGGATLTPVTIINNFDYPFVAPAQLKFGMSASTGSITNYHEIRNMTIEATNNNVLAAPTLLNDNGTSACQGQQAIMDIAHNDHSNNTGGSIDRESIDLDPLTAGRQTSVTDPGKGSYIINDIGIISFTPNIGFSGTSSINYTAADNYGIFASSPASVSINVSASTGPLLTIQDPVAACSPSVINITNTLYKTGTTPGAIYNYYNSLSDANNNINNINAVASSVTNSGSYFIAATLSGCTTIKPIVVTINAAPSAAAAGADQSYCSSTGVQTATLLATNPEVGSGVWTLMSGPSGSTVTFAQAATSPVLFTQKGVYVYRWTVSNGACVSSTDDIQITVGNTTADAGSDQSIALANQATLHANTPAIGNGVWSLISSPASSTVLINQPTNPNTTVNLNKSGDYQFRWTINNGSCSNNDAVQVAFLAVLPVEWISFTVKHVKDEAHIQWITAAETNNKRFELERSNDGIHFQKVASIAGHFTTSEQQEYNYQDATHGLSGTIYYRVKQFDIDERFNYSKVISININDIEKISAWPNPVIDRLYLKLPAASNGHVQMHLFNTSGILLRSAVFQTGNGVPLTIDHLSTLPPGMYFLRLTANEFQEKVTFLKVH